MYMVRAGNRVVSRAYSLVPFERDEVFLCFTGKFFPALYSEIGIFEILPGENESIKEKSHEQQH